ncbi:MAG: tRNA (guanosine(37)-N1)-methyltransferase TrmD [Candidatus Omnitrophica bacterium]|nr:tRNA (guanosine(37)-N1)-methyltransferase TrmD [Candidatus Omnitrophota bacterium]
MLKIEIITLFPEMFTGPLSESMVKIAQAKKKVAITIHNLRDYTHDKHKTCDDKPFGGGPGMVMKPEPLFEAIEAIKKKRKKAKVILLSPQGKPFTQKMAKQFSKKEAVIFICGHYEGIDERVRKHTVDAEVSIGDFVMTGGELAAMCIIDATTRLIPGVLGNDQSIIHESFQTKLLDHPHYTRPRVYRNHAVPEILLSGNHKEIERWRKNEALAITKNKRPDLLA